MSDEIQPEMRDSLGEVQPTSSANSIATDSRSVLGRDFAQPCDAATVGRILTRLVAGIGEPYGDSPDVMQLKAIEWHTALQDLPAQTVDDAVSDWIRTGTKWPKPSEIRKLAEARLNVRVEQVATARKIHPRRLQPAESMKGFVFEQSKLRSNATWRTFLDQIHPTAEHCFFAGAEMLRYANEIKVRTAFEASRIVSEWGEVLSDAEPRPTR